MSDPDDAGKWLDRLKQGEGRDRLEQAVHAAIHRVLTEDAQPGDAAAERGRHDRLFARLRKEGLLDGRPVWRWRHYARAASVLLAVGVVAAMLERSHRPVAPAEVTETQRERGVEAVFRLASENPAADARAVLAEFDTLHIPCRVVHSDATRSVLRVTIAASQLPVFRGWLRSRGVALEIDEPGEYRLIIGK